MPNVKFFYPADNCPRVDRALIGVPVLYTAAYCWNKSTKKFRIPNGLGQATEIMIDSGGFSYLKDGKYPFTVEEYTHYVAMFMDAYPGKVTRIVTPDYPCTNMTLDHKWNIEESIRIGWEVVDSLPQHKEEPDFYITIHGMKETDYIDSIAKFTHSRFPVDCLDEDEMPDEYDDMMELDYHENRFQIAIGSLKKREVPEVRRILTYARNHISGYTSIHAFGIALKFLKDAEIRKCINSSDSGAWRGHMPRGPDEKIRRFHAYKQRIEAVVN